MVPCKGRTGEVLHTSCVTLEQQLSRRRTFCGSEGGRSACRRQQGLRRDMRPSSPMRPAICKLSAVRIRVRQAGELDCEWERINHVATRAERCVPDDGARLTILGCCQTRKARCSTWHTSLGRSRPLASWASVRATSVERIQATLRTFSILSCFRRSALHSAHSYFTFDLY